MWLLFVCMLHILLWWRDRTILEKHVYSDFCRKLLISQTDDHNTHCDSKAPVSLFVQSTNNHQWDLYSKCVSITSLFRSQFSFVYESFDTCHRRTSRQDFLDPPPGVGTVVSSTSTLSGTECSEKMTFAQAKAETKLVWVQVVFSNSFRERIFQSLPFHLLLLVAEDSW